MITNYKSIYLAIVLLFALPASVSAAPGDLDPTFGNGGKRTDWTGYASGVAIQPDGKIVVVGEPNRCCLPDIDFRVARYNPDGSPDTTFGGGIGRVTTDFNGNHDTSWSVVLQPDRKIIVAGWTAQQSSGVSLAVARYNPDGSLDTTFGGGSGKVLTPLDYFGLGQTDVAIQPDGRILVVLAQIDLNGNDYGLLVRYSADGSPDTSFGMGGSVFSQLPMFSVTVQPADGKIVVNEGYGLHSIARFNPNGSLDTGFGSGGRVILPLGFWCFSLAIDSAGKIVTAGRSVTGSTFEFALVRFNVDGSPDSSFDGDGIVTTPSLEMANSIVIQSDGKIVAAGYGPGPGNYDLALARYNSNGSLDNTFGGGDGITTVDFNNSSDFGAAVALDNQGRAVVVGGTGPVGGSGQMYTFAIARFLADPTPTCPNPIDCPDFFVRQHYLDFLGREPDAGGQDYWTQQIADCGSDQRCISHRRIGVSGAFFGEPEFQRTGSFVYRLYTGGLGRRPSYSEFESDRHNIVEGPTLEQTKQAFTLAFVQRSGFIAAYSGKTTADLFVDALIARVQQVSGVNLAGRRSEFVSVYANGADQNESQAQVLRLAIDDPGFTAAEYNPSFVLMEYFGYLHRDPDQAGYDFWLNIINNREPNNYRGMVCAFITSQEYQLRFGSTLTRSNADCGQ